MAGTNSSKSSFETLFAALKLKSSSFKTLAGCLLSLRRFDIEWIWSAIGNSLLL